MDLRQLRTFVQVAELGSFTRAAHVLQVAQPALSRHVRALEVELRQALFQRHGRGVVLTDAGARLLAHGRGILQQVERARLDLADPEGGSAGLLSIGLPPSVSHTLTTPLVEAFRQRFPRATLSMVEGLSHYALEWLLQGRIDCAVVYNATPAAAIDLQPVLEEELFLVQGQAVPPTVVATPGPRRAGRAGAGHAAGAPVTAPPPACSLAELAGRPLVIPGRPHAIRMRVEAVLAQAGLKPTVALEIDSVPAILDLVRRHPMHAVLTRNALRASGHEHAYAARAIDTGSGRPGLMTSLWIATSAQRPRGRLLDEACTLLAALLRQRLGAVP